MPNSTEVDFIIKFAKENGKLKVYNAVDVKNPLKQLAKAFNRNLNKYYEQ
jgi:hypothetical protein